MKPNPRLEIAHEDIPVPKYCSRFTLYPRDVSTKNAIVYLKLRKDGCNKKSALAFSSKILCRTDASKLKDGPSNFRTLKVKKNPMSITTHGWGSEPPNYDLGPRYHLSPDDFLHRDPQSKYFEQHFGRHESKIKEDYKQKLRLLQEYFDDINAKCGFTQLSRRELYSKLKRETTALKSPKSPKQIDFSGYHNISSPQNLGGYDENPSDMINSYAFQPNSPHSRDSKLNTFYQQTFPSSKHTVDFASSQKILEANRSAGGFSEGGKAFNRQASYAISAENTIENVRSLKDFKDFDYDDEEEEEEEEDEENGEVVGVRVGKKKYTKNMNNAYEELENRTNMLVKLTNEAEEGASVVPEDMRHKKKQGKKSKLLRLASISALKKTEEDEIQKKAMKNNELADEFNRLNYMFFNKDKKPEETTPNSPIHRVMKANQERRQRREQEVQEKNLFDRIFKMQAQKNSQRTAAPPDSKNLEILRKQHEELRQSFQKRSGVDPYLFTSFRSQVRESSTGSHNNSNRSDKISFLPSSKYPSQPASPRSLNPSKSRERKPLVKVQRKPFPKDEITLKPKPAVVKILQSRDNSPKHKKNKSQSMRTSGRKFIPLISTRPELP